MHAQVSTFEIIGTYFGLSILFLLHLFLNIYFCRILRNEHSPKFTIDNNTATISVTHPLGQMVLTVSATDDDSILQGHTKNSRITYSIDPKYTAAIRYSFSLQLVYLYTNDMVSGLYYSYFYVC